MQSLAQVGERTNETNDLLSKLTLQQNQLEEATVALNAIQQFRQSVQVELGSTSEALQSLEQLRSLQNDLIEQRASIALAAESLGEMIAVHQCLIEKQGSALQAREIIQQLMALTTKLNSEELDIALADQKLEKLLVVESRLNISVDNVVDTIESLELLDDLREELNLQIHSMGEMRRGLMEIVLLESTVAKALRMLEPLTQLGNLRRLSDADVKQSVRTIIAERRSRLTSNRSSIAHASTDQSRLLHEADLFEATENGFVEKLPPFVPFEKTDRCRWPMIPVEL